MRVTALGLRALLFLALLWATFFAIPYTNLYFLGITFLTVWLVLAATWTIANLRGLDARGLRGSTARAPGQPFAIPAGSSFRLQFDVSPRGRPRAGVGVVVDLPDGPVRSMAVPVEGSASSVTVELSGLPRGVHAVRRAFVISSAPFGLFARRVPLPGLDELVVYPAPAAAPALTGHVMAESTRTVRAAGRRPRTDEVTGLREYRAGDEPRSVHWRASARRDALVVRQMASPNAGGPELILDRRVEPAALEANLSAAVTVALRARDEQSPLTIHTQGMRREFTCVGRDFDALLRILAELRTTGLDAGPPVARSQRTAGAHR